MIDTAFGETLILALTAVLAWWVGRLQIGRADDQLRLGATAFASDWFRDLRAWASEAIDVISEATYCCREAEIDTDIYQSVATRCRHRLSALIDRGRFFLPNEGHKEQGMDKPSAYRGNRQEALNFLVAVEKLLGGVDREAFLDFGESQKEQIINLRRGFVSSVHDILDPRERNRQLKVLLESVTVPPEQRKLRDM
jgi:hypothetical protein